MNNIYIFIKIIKKNLQKKIYIIIYYKKLQKNNLQINIYAYIFFFKKNLKGKMWTTWAT